MGSLCSNERNSSTIPKSFHRTASLSSNLSSTSDLSTFSLKSEERNFYSTYEIFQDIIGSGTHGEIRKCENKYTGQVFAVKLVTKSSLPQEVIHKRLIPKQFKMLSVLDHPSILKIHEMFEDRNRYFILMDLVNGKDLFEKIKDSIYLSEVVAARIMKQVFSGLAYMHSKNIAHRDIKPENILIEEKNKKLSIKIIDFDTAVNVKDRSLYDRQGSVCYVAPEVLKGKYNEKCDVWSAGVTLFVMLTGRFPFNGENEEELIENIKNSKVDFDYLRSERISEDAIHLLQRVMEKKKSKRFTAAEASHHHWILKNCYGPVPVPDLKPYCPLAHAIKLWSAKYVLSSTDIVKYKVAFVESDIKDDGVLDTDEILQYFPNISREKALEIIHHAYWKEPENIDLYEFISVMADKEFWIAHLENIMTAIVWSIDGDLDSQCFIEFLCGKLEPGNRFGSNLIPDRLKKEDVIGFLSC